ncbi:TPA: hypothetical protein QEM47_000946 [Pseudomonas putida]|uniref:hypothetical protein n=1 Tax=Pseudomonas putida TaxID=303 RepID=UPI000A8DE0B8|nr:hypothetical protein [Pseudomonas putida]MDD2116709.1 hypothetical protein [Pseudomonas putida]UPU94031.1 hypothetical protein M0766_06500 [Pseudomonas putida]HDS1728223.1 hypothetical protein [Pseudomonas putida]
MPLAQDRYYSYEIPLEEGLTAYVHCNWIDSEPGHVASEASVVVRQGDTENEIGRIKGPIQRDEANEQGTKIAEGWYAKQKGIATE